MERKDDLLATYKITKQNQPRHKFWEKIKLKKDNTGIKGTGILIQTYIYAQKR
jgi:hypothetical protein